MKLVIPAGEENVISLTSVRESIRSKLLLKNGCTHRNVVADASLMYLQCKDCGRDVSAVQWLLDHTEFLTSLKNEREALREEREKRKAKRCRCEHCGRLTSVNGEGFVQSAEGPR